MIYKWIAQYGRTKNMKLVYRIIEKNFPFKKKIIYESLSQEDTDNYLHRLAGIRHWGWNADTAEILSRYHLNKWRSYLWCSVWGNVYTGGGDGD